MKTLALPPYISFVYVYFIAPSIFYLEVTAFTMYCPIKALFSNYSHPPKFE